MAVAAPRNVLYALGGLIEIYEGFSVTVAEGIVIRCIGAVILFAPIHEYT